MEVIVIAMMDNAMDHTFESANRIYGVGGDESYYSDRMWWWAYSENIGNEVGRCNE